MQADVFLRELPHSLGFHGEGKACSHIHTGGVSSYPFPCGSAHFFVMFCRSLQNACIGPATSQPSSLDIFSNDTTSFSAASSPHWGQPYSNFMCLGPHVANPSPCLSWFMSFSWADVQLPLGMDSGSVLCTEKPGGHVGVTASSSTFFLSLLVSCSFLRAYALVPLWQSTLIISEGSKPFVSSKSGIFAILFPFSFLKKSEFMIHSFSDNCFEKKNSSEFRMCGTWMGNR